jgi:PIN domain nuclease of toxin-antitoxin system
MTFVTDTHGFVFYATGKIDLLGRRARRVYAQAEMRRATIYIPTVCFFEITLLLERGRIKSNLPFPAWKAKAEQSASFIVEPLTWEDVYEAQSLVSLSDPFDRLIAGVANRLQVPLITRDSELVDSGTLETLW